MFVHRMDPNSSYLLEIRLFCNPKKYSKDHATLNFSKVVDSDTCNFKNLVKEIVDQYPHGYEENVHVFHYNDVLKTFPQVTTDQELLVMFSKHVDRKVVHLSISYTDPTDGVPIPPPILLSNSDLLDIPCTPSMPCPSIVAASISTQPPTNEPTDFDSDQPADSDHFDDDDDNYLANPEPQNKHVGVDDEGLYLPPSKEHGQGEDGVESDSDDSDVDYEEVDGLIGKDPPRPIPIASYDKDDPPMSVGSIYPNMREFRLALSQHAINREFEYNIEKSDPGRLRAYCSRWEEENCRWSLYAKTTKDRVTIKVIVI